MSRKPIIAGNWKLNNIVDESVALVEDIKIKLMSEDASKLPTVVVCPTYISLYPVCKVLEHGKSIFLGAQNCFYKDSGAYTGEISLPMLQDLCVSYVILGHSERRQYFGETDENVNLKTKACLAHKITPIICCGESLEQREAGVTDEVVSKQIKAALAGISADDVATLVFAYEPIWAIGTGKTCESVEANRVIKMIRDTIAEVSSKEAAEKARILYGGSVKASSIVEQMAQSDIDGALVGGASLEAESFAGIVKGAMK